MMTWDESLIPELQAFSMETDPVVHGLTDPFSIHWLRSGQTKMRQKFLMMRSSTVQMTRVVLLLSCEIVHYHVTNLVDLAL